MSTRASVRAFGWALLSGAMLFAIQMRADTGDAPLKKQLPADQRAFGAAQATHVPEQRLAAMRAFVAAYPKSSRAGRAEDAILTILLKNFPERTGEVDAAAKKLVKGSDKGLSRDYEQTYVAFRMAEAGTDGVDLKRAEKLARNSVNHLVEASFDRDQAASYVKYKMPAPKPAEMHADFANTRADALAVLADVELRQGRQQQAADLTREAYVLDPMVDDVNTMRGRLALANHDDAGALDGFERAQLLGTLAPADRSRMMELYRAAHGGSDAGFETAMDTRYAEIFPAAAVRERPKPVTGGHTVLVELFTGSACAPCVGGDLAVEGLLEAYPRTEVVALAFDQHIPEPDPLANADGVARAAVYDVASTPSYVVDGRKQKIFGGSRTEGDKLYAELRAAVDAAAVLPTGVHLQLSATAGDGGTVRAEARVTLPDAAELRKAVAAGVAAPAVGTDGKAGAAKAGVAAAPGPPQMVVNFALVEDDVRYSGENGMRFHRMVVRCLAKPAAAGFAAEPGAATTLAATFDPAAISQGLHTYLDDYAKNNVRFGQITFLSTNTAMEQRHLAVAAWVQDAVTHRVLAAAITPLSEPQTVGGQ